MRSLAVVGLAGLIGITACSILAPSDDELMGGSAHDSSVVPDASSGGKHKDSGAGGSVASGGASGSGGTIATGGTTPSGGMAGTPPSGGGQAGSPPSGGGTAGASDAAVDVTSQSLCQGYCGQSIAIKNPTGGSCYCDVQCMVEDNCCPGFVQTCETHVVACKNEFCATNQICCALMLTSTFYTTSCVSDQGTQCTSMDIHCDGPEDCGAGEVCCGTLGTPNSFDTVQCQKANECSYNQGKRVICSTDDQACPTGYTCKPLGLKGFSYCGI